MCHILNAPQSVNAGHGASLDALGLLGLTDPDSDSTEEKVINRKQRKRRSKEVGEDGEERPREHPFIVTEPGEPAKGKKNGLDYLFDLYEQCGKFLEEVQQLAREKGEKCPFKVICGIQFSLIHLFALFAFIIQVRFYAKCPYICVNSKL